MTAPPDWLPGPESFPDPGPMPTQGGEEPRDEFLARLNEWNWAATVRTAVLGSNPEARTRASEVLLHLLIENADLRPPMRDWIAFVVGTALLSGTLPSLYRGRPTEPRRRAALLENIAERLLDLQSKHPKRTLIDHLHQIADDTSKSFDTVEKIYKSRPFKAWLEFKEWERKQRGREGIPPSP